MSVPVLKIEHKLTGRARFVSLGKNFEITRKRCNAVLLEWCARYRHQGAHPDDYRWTLLMPVPVKDE